MLTTLLAPRLLVTLILTLLLTSRASASAIYQAFDQRFDEVASMLDELQALGYTYVQVSPPQKSLDRPEWWARYQPVDYFVLDNHLGNEQDLARLVTLAHAKGLKILIDVVLNHMADPYMSGHPDLNYPQFSWQDFRRPDTRDCISDWGSRKQVTQYWLCDPRRNHHLPDLDTSSRYVRHIHKQHLHKLLNLGVDGFRIDAMKHIEPEYFEDLMQVLPTDRFYYGEVIGGSMEETRLYTGFMPVTDFHLLRVLLSAFSLNGDLRWLKHPEGVGAALPGSQAVVFARNHDTAMDPSFFNFGDHRDAMLAAAFVVGRGVGIPLIYRDDYRDPFVVTSLRFRNALSGKHAYVRPVEEICPDTQVCNPRTTLVLERGDTGLMVINSANHWVDAASARMPGIQEGCYQELNHGFTMTVDRGSDGQKWINRWVTSQRGGLHIGPRSALFFVKTSQDACS